MSVVKGIGGRKKKKEELARMVNIGKFMIGENIKQTKKKVQCPRGKYDNPEARIRNYVIEELRKSGVVVKRIENAITGKNNKSIPDLWFFNPALEMAGWIECKSSTGVLSKGPDSQEEFQSLCNMCGIKYFIVRSSKDAMEKVWLK